MQESVRRVVLSGSFLGVLALFLSCLCQAQSFDVDSLKLKIAELEGSKSYTNDTSRVNTLNLLSWEFKKASEYERADSAARAALELAQKIKFQKGVAKAYHNMGIVAKSQSNYPLALQYYFEALKINEIIKNKKGMAANLNNIGIVYDDNRDFEKALKYYFKALAINEELKNKHWIGYNLGNIGTIYMSKGDFDHALEYLFRALKIDEELDNQNSTNMGNIGEAFKEKGDYKKAEEFFIRALKVDEKLDNKSGISLHLANLGGLYARQKKYDKAEDYLKSSLIISKQIGDLVGEKDCHHELSDLYKAQRKWSDALYHYESFIGIRDSIFNEENTEKSVRAEMNFEYEKKSTADSIKNAEQQKSKDIAQKAELQQERTKRYSLYGGLGLVLVFSGFLFNRFKVTSRQKQVIEEQKLIVEVKNKEVMDSINYARRIQDALLKEEEHVTAHLPEHFVLFKPKAIVSGDFYWSMEKQGYWYLAVADCTGHGVPGAFMSMLGIAYLNEINASERVLSPAEILDKLREKIVKELKQSGETGESKDGMDISLIRFHLQTNELEWAGANNSLLVIPQRASSAERVAQYKADKQPIGYTVNPKPFTNHTIQLTSGDSLYLFSDGYVDQFGGPQGKKFKYKRLLQKLVEVNHESLAVRKELLDGIFESWRGRNEQLDDVAMVGIRV
jgi:serine phosphatase RsbU (regulator of sigma subunit)/tetratricopeptide (TPR) repeat protein